MNIKTHLNLFATAASLLVAHGAVAATLTWDAGGGGGAITNGGGAWLGANLWNDGGAATTWTSGDDAIFGGPATAGGAVTLASPTTVNSFTFNPSFSGTYTLGTAGQTMTLNNGITMNAGAGAGTIVSPITLGGAQTWTNNSSASLAATGGVDLDGNALAFLGSGTIAFNNTANIISGAGGITYSGTGRLTLGAGGTTPAHTYSGVTSLNGGVIMFNGNTGNLSANSNINLNGAILESYWTGGLTRALGSNPNELRITGGESGFSMNGATGATFDLGASVIDWGGANFNPSKFVLQSQYSQNNASVTFSSPINLNGADRTIVANSGSVGTATATLSAAISNSTGTAGLIKEGAGQLILSTTNSYNGNTSVNQGVLTATVTGALPGFNAAGRVIVADGATIGVRTGAWTAGNIDTLRANATWSTTGSRLGLDTTSGAFTYASNITEALSVHKLGGQNLTLTGANTYTGKTYLSGGSVLVSSFGNVADPSSPLGTNSTIELLNGGTITFTGSTVQSSDKTFNVTGTGTIYASGTGVGAITLTADINPTSTSNKTLNLFGANTNDNTISGNISNGAGGTLAITKNLAGTWILSGSNSHTGGTTLSGGKLLIRGSGALGAGTFTWGTNGTTLHAQNDSSVALSNTFSTTGRDITRTLVVDRQTPGDAVNLTINSARINLDTSNVYNITKGANITTGTPTVTFANGTGSSDSNNGSLSGGASAGPVTFNPVGVNLVINNGITSSARTRGYIFQGDTDGNILAGTFQNGTGTSVRKTGSGTWRFNGTGQYTGPTEVVEGTLLVNGTTLATGLVNVSSGATLGGNGTVGQVTVADGFLSPGDALDNVFTVNSLTLEPSATVVFGLDDPFSFDGNDFVQIIDSLTLAGQIHIHAQPGGSGYDFLTATPGTQWLVMTYAPGNLFSAGDVTIGSAPTLSSGLAWSVDTTTTDGSVFLTVVVPEAGTAGLVALGLLFLRRLRRR